MNVSSLPVHLVKAATRDDLTLHGAFLPAFPEARTSSFDAVLLMHGVANTFYNNLSPLIGVSLATGSYASLRANNRGHDVIARGNAAQPFLGAAFERLADSGVAVLIISSYLTEIRSLSDRILVARQGRIVAEFDLASAYEERIIYADV